MAIFEANGVGFGRVAVGDGGLCDGGGGRLGFRNEGDDVFDGVVQDGKNFGNHRDIDVRESALADGIIAEAGEGEPKLDICPPKGSEAFMFL